MIVLYNPLSTTPGKGPLPLSLMALAAVLEPSPDAIDWTLVDGNLVADPAAEIIERLEPENRRGPALLAVTVMPGPQVTQAVRVCTRVRAAHPDVPIVWGGYFPTQHADTVLAASFVDFVVRSQGEQPLVDLIRALRSGGALECVNGLSWKDGDRIRHNDRGAMVPLDELPDLPYARVPIERYIHRNYLGRRTIAHNSSFGCPFACSFCAVVAMTNRKWLAQSAARVESVLRRLVSGHRIDAVQMHDMDFFISEARTSEFSERITDLNLNWWGLGRVDTLMQYSEATWRAMARSGLRMVFSGVESASDASLAAMNKGGKASAQLALDLAYRMRLHGVVPEFSFVIGSPPDPMADLAETFAFIRKVKEVNPSTEIVLYSYTPVPMDGRLYEEATRLGFAFPRTLDDWASEGWQRLSMRRGDGIPWMDGGVRTRVRNFERVLNAYYPTVTDGRLTPRRRAVLKAASAWRYNWRVYGAPYELRALQRVLKYQRPETTGF